MPKFSTSEHSVLSSTVQIRPINRSCRSGKIGFVHAISEEHAGQYIVLSSIMPPGLLSFVQTKLFVGFKTD